MINLNPGMILRIGENEFNTIEGYYIIVQVKKFKRTKNDLYSVHLNRPCWVGSHSTNITVFDNELMKVEGKNIIKFKEEEGN